MYRTFVFPETIFTAVTAYQNQLVSVCEGEKGKRKAREKKKMQMSMKREEESNEGKKFFSSCSL